MRLSFMIGSKRMDRMGNSVCFIALRGIADLVKRFTQTVTIRGVPLQSLRRRVAISLWGIPTHPGQARTEAVGLQPTRRSCS